ncbi:urea ABC transporter ATP-binding protein UrtD [soil metagenome]
MSRTSPASDQGDREHLEVRGLTVDFDGFRAIDDVDLSLHTGELHFLIGPNGAGKTTLVDAVTGLVKATGSAQYRGRDLLAMKSHQIVRAGVGRTFQTATVFEELTVVQNLDIAGGVHRSAWGMFRSRRGLPAYVAEALETIGLTAVKDRPAGTLAHGQRQWLEIGMLLVQDAAVMLIDEPVAGMSAEEREQTGELLKHIGTTRTTVVIEHDMEFVRSFADTVTVMHAGKVLTHGTVAEIQANSQVQEVYLGRIAEGATHA